MQKESLVSIRVRTAAPAWLCIFHYVKLHVPGGSDGKVSAYNVGGLGSIPELGRSPGEGNGNPLQHSCLENPTDGGAWWTAAHGVAKSQTRLSNFTFHFSLSCIGEGNGNPLQCSCLENPRDGGAWWCLQSLWDHRVGHYWSDLAAVAAAWLIHVGLTENKAIILHLK